MLCRIVRVRRLHGVHTRSFSVQMPENAAQSSWTVIEHVQGALEALHTTTGLPWWATIACSAISIRAALFPFVLYQIKAQQR